MKIKLPRAVQTIINILNEHVHEAYAVGGAVRDAVLGRVPKDWDVTTDALPEEIKDIFNRTVDTGIEHGTVTVLMGGAGYEVTTYRIDGEYEDSRHPKEVTFTANLVEDLKRRDFTINAMAYNDRAGLVDVFEGILDIERKMIRCVGCPKERFTEDALRMMRAVRFSAQLGYEIEENTAAAIKELAGNLVNISAERIQTELVKLVTSPHPENLKIAYETGITKVIMPEFDVCMETVQNNPHHCYTVGEHTLKSMQYIKPDKVLRLAMLFHDIGKPSTISTDEEGIDHFYGHPDVSAEMARKILRRLKFDNYTLHMVTGLVKYHDRNVEPTPKYVRRAILKVGEEIFPLLYDIKKADIAAQSDYKREEKAGKLEQVYEAYAEVLEKNQCVSLKTLAVTGKDLITQAGMQTGPELGRVLEKLLQEVIEDPELNTKETLLEMALKYKK